MVNVVARPEKTTPAWGLLQIVARYAHQQSVEEVKQEGLSEARTLNDEPDMDESSYLGLHNWQLHMKCCPFPEAAFHGDPASMDIDHFLDNFRSETGPA